MATKTDNSVPEITTTEQAEALQAALARFATQQAADAAKAREDRLKPLCEILNDPAYSNLLDRLTAVHMSGAYLSDNTIDINLRALVSIMPALRAAAA